MTCLRGDSLNFTNRVDDWVTDVFLWAGQQQGLSSNGLRIDKCYKQSLGATTFAI